MVSGALLADLNIAQASRRYAYHHLQLVDHGAIMIEQQHYRGTMHAWPD